MNNLLTAGCAAAAFAAILTGTASDATANAPCGKAASDIDHSAYVNATSSAANIRTGSSTGCTPIGSLLAGQRIDYYCYTVAGSFTWSYLRDVATGKVGWVRDDLLPGVGSTVYCGF